MIIFSKMNVLHICTERLAVTDYEKTTGEKRLMENADYNPGHGSWIESRIRIPKELYGGL